MKPPPFAHQARALAASHDRAVFALLMEMGTGKSRVVLDTATYLHAAGEIDALLVVAPCGVHTNWVLQEIPRHVDEPVVARWWDSGRAGRARYDAWLAEAFASRDVRLRVLCVNVEALSTKRGRAMAEEFVTSCGGRVLVAIDESTTIKAIRAKRTRGAMALGKLARYRRILTGTPVTQSPLDVYAQFNFLDPRILGFATFTAFRSHFCVLRKRMMSGNGRTWQFEEIVGYRRLEELRKLIAPHSFRVTKADCLDLPEKIYTRIIVELSREQRRRYDALVSEYVMLTASNERVPVPMALTRLLRMQQVTGGFVTDETETRAEAIPGSNPKIDALLADVETVPSEESVIIWCRFRAEIVAVADALRSAYGRDVVGTYYGDTASSERASLVDAFQARKIRFFVGTPQAAGLGLTLTAGSVVYYLSNGFSSSDRQQSEDRAHRIGTTRPVVYKDVVCRDTVDEHVLTVLRAKRDVAAAVLGDPMSMVRGGEVPGDAVSASSFEEGTWEEIGRGVDN